jgi:Domain of unknown function (DUF5102)
MNTNNEMNERDGARGSDDFDDFEDGAQGGADDDFGDFDDGFEKPDDVGVMTPTAPRPGEAEELISSFVSIHSSRQLLILIKHLYSQY